MAARMSQRNLLGRFFGDGSFWLMGELRTLGLRMQGEFWEEGDLTLGVLLPRFAANQILNL